MTRMNSQEWVADAARPNAGVDVSKQHLDACWGSCELRVANDELAALRRVATLVAEGVPPRDLFAVVAEEVARVINVPLVSVIRFELDGTATD